VSTGTETATPGTSDRVQRRSHTGKSSQVVVTLRARDDAGAREPLLRVASIHRVENTASPFPCLCCETDPVLDLTDRCRASSVCPIDVTPAKR
jgi:hypothetical protein